MHWIFHRFYVKFVVETFFFNKTHFSEVLWLLQWVLFPGKDYCILLLVLLALNKFYSWFYWFWISSLTLWLKETWISNVKLKVIKFVYRLIEISLFWSEAVCICQSQDFMVMASLVPGGRWPLESFPSGPKHRRWLSLKRISSFVGGSSIFIVTKRWN